MAAWMLVACNSSGPVSDASADGTMPDTGGSDGAKLDASNDAEGGACASGGIACFKACAMLAPNYYSPFTSAFFYDCGECAQSSKCVDQRPCYSTMPEPDCPCLACLVPKLQPSAGWAMCQTNAECKAFAECLVKCPID